MPKVSDSQIRGLISLALLVLLCIGLIVFCVLYLADAESSVQSHLNNSESVESEHEHHENKSEDNNEGPSEEVSTPSAIDTEEAEIPEETVEEPVIDEPEYRIKLNKNDNSSSGIVYIETDDREGFVCTDGFDTNAATVTCRELGFKHGVAYNNRVDHYHYTRYTLDEPILSLLNCSGNEPKLSKCDGFRLDNETTCTWFTGVVCYNEDDPYELRLVNGTHPDSGLVEMKVGGEWGIFCAIHNFDDEVADILCRNMNFTGGLTILSGELGSVPEDTKVWVPYIFCSSEFEIKQTIFECTLTLHTDNVLYDHIEFRNNRYRYQFMACLGENAHAAAVQCLK